MTVITKLKLFIKNLEAKELYLYIAGYFAILFLLFGILIYIHVSKKHTYTDPQSGLFSILNKNRTETQKLLTRQKTIQKERDKVEEILSQNKAFNIKETYLDIINRPNLNLTQSQEPTSGKGQTIAGKTEIILVAHLKDITMKQLTDLLSALGEIPQIYPKDLVIDRVDKMQRINADLTIATLESSTPG